MMDTLQNSIERAASALRGAKSVLILTGAGVSKESGIPTYRDALSGLWAEYDFMQLATPEGFLQNPAMVWDWYAERRVQIRTVAPNAGHLAITRLASRLPHVSIITQNVDDLHERAGSQGVLHLHGNLAQICCFAHCQGEPTLVDEADFVIGPDSPPRCPHCGAMLRPAVVWFGENLPRGTYEAAHQAALDCDVCIVAGTSSEVFPAAQLPLTAQMTGSLVISINTEARANPNADIDLIGPFGQVMPALVDAVERE